MARPPRAPFHPSLFSPGEVPPGREYRPRLRPVQPAGAVIPGATAEIAQLLNRLFQCSVLAQIAVSRVDEGGWNLIEKEIGRFYARGGVLTLIVGRLFDLPRLVGTAPAGWRDGARAALERGLRFWTGVAEEARVIYWPRFAGNVYFFDATGALHALVGSAPLTERALRRNGGEGRCDVSLHLTASDPEWAAGGLELEERAASVAALHPIYTFFNGEPTGRSPDSAHELIPARLAHALADPARAAGWLAKAPSIMDTAALEMYLLRRLAEDAPNDPVARVVFEQDDRRPHALALDSAAAPLLEDAAEEAAVVFRTPQPRFDFRALVHASGTGSSRRFTLTSVPPSRLAALLRHGRLRPGDPFLLARQGPRTFRLTRVAG